MINKSFNSIRVADGTTMDIWVTYPDDGGRYPAIFLLHEGCGINTYIRSVAERLCRAGYVVFAPDLLHRNNRLTTMPFTQSATIPCAEEINDELFLHDIRSVFAVCISMKNIDHGRIGVLGFGMGGSCAFMANGNFPFSAGISYYSCGIERLADSSIELQSPHLFFWAGRDTYISHAEVDRVCYLNRIHARDFTSVTISYAEHGFHRDECSSYHPLAARQAWMHTLAFLDYLLK
jgi:carboxymethylenebutenolidase